MFLGLFEAGKGRVFHYDMMEPLFTDKCKITFGPSKWKTLKSFKKLVKLLFISQTRKTYFTNTFVLHQNKQVCRHQQKYTYSRRITETSDANRTAPFEAPLACNSNSLGTFLTHRDVANTKRTKTTNYITTFYSQ